MCHRRLRNLEPVPQIRIRVPVKGETGRSTIHVNPLLAVECSRGRDNRTTDCNRMHGIREDGGSGPRIELVQEQSNTLQFMNANKFKDIYV